MRESWDSSEYREELLDFVQEGRVIPVVGWDLLNVKDGEEDVPLERYLATRLAHKLDVSADDLPACHELNTVACRHLERRGDPERLDSRLKRLFPAPGELAIPETLVKLAKIEPLRLFVSMTFDPLLERALNEVRFSGRPNTQAIAYSPEDVEDLSTTTRMRGVMIFTRVKRAVASVALVSLAGCGSGWAPFLDDSSSSSSSSPDSFEVTSLPDGMDPGRIDIGFNRDVSETSLVGNIEIYVDGEEDDVYDELVLTRVVSGSALVLKTKQMRLLGSYEVVLRAGVESVSGVPLDGDTEVGFRVREGAWGLPEILSFFSRKGSISMQDDGRAVISLLPTDGFGQTTVGVTSAAEGEFWEFPEIIYQTNEVVRNGGLSAANDDLRLLQWLEGDPNVGWTTDGPVVKLMSSAYEAGQWETHGSVSTVDEGLPAKRISWRPRRVILDDSVAVMTWWAWTGWNDATKDFDHWGVYSAIRRNQEWERPTLRSPSNVGPIGWPLLVEGPEDLWMIYAEAVERRDLFDCDDSFSIAKYWITRFDVSSGTWDDPIEGPEGAFPRATSFRVVSVENKLTALVGGRSRGMGPVIVQVDLETNTWSGIQPLDPSGQTFLQDDGSKMAWVCAPNQMDTCECTCEGTFNKARVSTMRTAGSGNPRIIELSDGSTQVLWIGGASSHPVTCDSTPGQPRDVRTTVYRTELPLGDRWKETTIHSVTVTGQGADVLGAAATGDTHGNLLLMWIINEHDSSDIKVARYANGETPGWSAPVTITEGTPGCSRGMAIAVSGASGKAVIAWNEFDCGGTGDLISSGAARFK